MTQDFSVTILRIGHRAERDKRVTTHVALAGRALGAAGVIITGDHDGEMLRGLEKVARKWGGTFDVAYATGWEKIMKNFDGVKVHLTMYGERVQDRIGAIGKEARGRGGKLLVIVGGEKVPRGVYDAADYNIGVTNQPHSEVSALAVFLHLLFEGKELEKKFDGAAIVVKGNARGKTVEKHI